MDFGRDSYFDLFECEYVGASFCEVIGWDETDRHSPPVALAYRTLFVRSWR